MLVLEGCSFMKISGSSNMEKAYRFLCVCVNVKICTYICVYTHTHDTDSIIQYSIVQCGKGNIT